MINRSMHFGCWFRHSGSKAKDKKLSWMWQGDETVDQVVTRVDRIRSEYIGGDIGGMFDVLEIKARGGQTEMVWMCRGGYSGHIGRRMKRL